MVRNRGQVTLEMALAFVMVVLLFWVAGKLFFWINNALVLRQQYYESDDSAYGRARAADPNVGTEIQVNEQGLSLDFFK